MIVVSIIREDTKWILDCINNSLGNEIINRGLVTAQDTTTIGSEMEVNKWLHCQVSIVIGSCLKREERIHIDSSNLQTLLSSVVGVDIGSSSLGGVLGVASIARVVLRQTK